MDEDLLSMWHDINKTYFDGELEPLAAIDWAPLSGENGIGAHGKFVPQSKCILIDELFRFDRDAIAKGDKAEAVNAEMAYGLMLHEMVHQALHEKNATRPGGHGEAFLAEAQRIAKQFGRELPSAENVCRWPLLSDDIDKSVDDEQIDH